MSDPKNQYERASAYADAVLAELRRLHVPPTPEAFSLWYNHVSGTDSELSAVLAELEERGDPLTPARLQSLYNQFLVTPVEAVGIKAQQELQGLLDRLLQQVDGASADTVAYNRALDGFREDLSGKAPRFPDGSELRQLICGMLEETSRVHQRTQRLETELARSGRRIAHLHADLAAARHEAVTDGLTGLANRKRFDHALEDAILATEASGEPLALLFTDVDHFKQFNDAHGHVIGDQVLKLVATILRRGLKGRDLPARYGGEEFAIILPNTTLGDAVTVGDQLRRAVAANRIVRKSDGSVLGTVTISVGAAVYRRGESAAGFVERADQALYAAKSAGRNCVCREAAPTRQGRHRISA